MIQLHSLPSRNTKTKRRVGRGNASNGTYSGRGMKGQRSRSGGKSGLARLAARAWVEKLPKAKGFTSIHAKPAWLDIAVLSDHFSDGDTVTPGLLKQKNLVSDIRNGVKLLGNSTVAKKLTIKNMYLSASARTAIEKAGGVIEQERVARTKRNKETLTNKEV